MDDLPTPAELRAPGAPPVCPPGVPPSMPGMTSGAGQSAAHGASSAHLLSVAPSSSGRNGLLVTGVPGGGQEVDPDVREEEGRVRRGMRSERAGGEGNGAALSVRGVSKSFKMGKKGCFSMKPQQQLKAVQVRRQSGSFLTCVPVTGVASARSCAALSQQRVMALLSKGDYKEGDSAIFLPLLLFPCVCSRRA